ncbi:MAG: cysteine hydrolase [Deltaproteobacteria bacterium]|nr:MAG: cysteine hydrolase [Deltaproteobacteria bacterium]TMQ13890.1 MAG: cysteine hydrolase [Deltaproteobacteria bacterium]
MTTQLPTNATLILIDVQEGFDAPYWGERNNPDAERHIEKLLSRWRATGRPVIHLRHDSVESDSALRPGSPGNAIKDEAAPAPGEPVVGKHVNSGFIGTDLEARLKAHASDTVVLCGFTTNHCVSTTARMAGNLGFRTFVLSDTTVAFAMRSPGPDGRVIPAAVMHEVGLAELNREFATILTTDELLALL